jgi:hypothetical protein
MCFFFLLHDAAFYAPTDNDCRHRKMPLSQQQMIATNLLKVLSALYFQLLTLELLA